MTPLSVKLRTAALDNAALTALLGTSPFRWYDRQLAEGSAYPAIVVLQVDAVSYQSQEARNAVSKCRTQFTVWQGQTPDDGSVEQALLEFLDTFSGTAVGTRSIVSPGKDGFYAETQPGIFQRLIDAFIFNDDTT